MKVLVIGNGAREHALTWKIAQSALVDLIYVAPGNAGTASIAQNLDIPATDIKGLIRKSVDLGIELVVVGPEAPLAAGIVDEFKSTSIPVFGPSRDAARLESSKVFTREILIKYGIPCARGRHFTDYSTAREYLSNQSAPIVIKADGLAAGKGVTVADTMESAQAALKSMMVDRVFGSAADQVIIEECLTGKEVSLLAFTDGKTVVPMIPACDYKRVSDGDKGPNTGGMGSYSPPGFFGHDMIQKITQTVIQPVVDAMNREGSPYCGVLYAGLMMSERGPMVLEFNARMGDPETQVILPRLKTDLAEIMLAVINHRLDKITIEWKDDPCVGIVMASAGYPGDYRKGFPITISGKLDPDINIFYAGAKQQSDGKIVTDGGRVLTLTSTGSTIKQAREKAYRNIRYINFEGCHYRTDIAAREVS